MPCYRGHGHDSCEVTEEVIVECFSECGVQIKSDIKAATDIGAVAGHVHEILKRFWGRPRDTLSDADGAEVSLVGGETFFLRQRTAKCRSASATLPLTTVWIKQRFFKVRSVF